MRMLNPCTMLGRVAPNLRYYSSQRSLTTTDTSV